MIDDYLHDADVAKLLGIGLGSLRNKISAGDPLPPSVVLPGMRSRIWPRQEFDQWIRQFLQLNAEQQIDDVRTAPTRKHKGRSRGK